MAAVGAFEGLKAMAELVGPVDEETMAVKVREQGS